MVAKVYSTALIGIDAVLVQIEAQLVSSLKRFTMLGLPDGVLKESRDRVRCAIENSGFYFPQGEVVVSLAPASLPKSGAAFDLGIAVSVLAADGLIKGERLASQIILGELALDGQVKAVTGVMAAACLLSQQPQYELLVPIENCWQAALLPGVVVRGVSSLLEAVAFLNSELDIPAEPYTEPVNKAHCLGAGFADVIGQYAAKRAMEIIAAGGHNLLMIGPPGAGKSMLAQRLPSILPPLSVSEAIEVTRLYSAYGNLFSVEYKTKGAESLITKRPFRAPHHTTSSVGLIGGGSNPVPGEISLAHKGVLFLDELTELKRDSIECLREPLEAKQVLISRAKVRIKFPADFILVAAMNPCPCGKYGQGDRSCICSANLIARYMSRISGPILDRLDLQLWVPAVPAAQLSLEIPEDPTPKMRERVLRARERQYLRLPSSAKLNSQLTTAEIKSLCVLDESGKKILSAAAEKYRFSARSYSRVLKVSRTIADLEGSDKITAAHLAEALSYRVSSLQ